MSHIIQSKLPNEAEESESDVDVTQHPFVTAPEELPECSDTEVFDEEGEVKNEGEEKGEEGNIEGEEGQKESSEIHLNGSRQSFLPEALLGNLGEDEKYRGSFATSAGTDVPLFQNQRQFFTIEVLTNRETSVLAWTTFVIYLILIVADLVVQLRVFTHDSGPVTSCGFGNAQTEAEFGCITYSPNATFENVWNRTFEWSILKAYWNLDVSVRNPNYTANNSFGPYNGVYVVNVAVYDQDEDDDSLFNPYMSKYFDYPVVCAEGAEFCNTVSVLSVVETMCSNDNCGRISPGVKTFRLSMGVVGSEFVPDNVPDSAMMWVSFERYDSRATVWMSSVSVVWYILMFVALIWFSYKSFSILPFGEWTVQHKLGILLCFSSVLQVSPFAILGFYFPEQEWLFYMNWILKVFASVGYYFLILLLVDSLSYRTGIKSMPFSAYKWKALVSICYLIVVLFYFFYSVASARRYLYFDVAGFNFHIDTQEDEVAESLFKVVNIFSIVYVVLLFLWGIYLTRITVLDMRKVPYVVTRFSNLSIRTTMLVFVLVVVYVMYDGVLMTIVDNDESMRGLLSSLYSGVRLTVVSAGVLISYCFLPAKASGHSIDSYKEKNNGFSMSACRRMMYFASEAYSVGREDVEGEITKEQLGCKKFTVVTEETTDTNALVCELRDKIVIAYRGTKSKKNMKTDLKMKLVAVDEQWIANKLDDIPHGILEELAETFGGKVGVHEGFLECHLLTRDEIIGAVKEYWHEEMGPICITGHSLGGAMGTLLAFELKVKHNLPVVMYNFGSPRVGNRMFAQMFDYYIPKAYRVCQDGDVITGFPKWGYRHVGTHVVIDAKGNLLVSMSGYEKMVMLKYRRKMSTHRTASYRNCVNRAYKVEKRLHVFLNAEVDFQTFREMAHVMKKNGQKVEYGLASTIPGATLSPNITASEIIQPTSCPQNNLNGNIV
eukprot:Nk52_evm29s2273 gene=Nk52_evmTU29s2273